MNHVQDPQNLLLLLQTTLPIPPPPRPFLPATSLLRLRQRFYLRLQGLPPTHSRGLPHSREPHNLQLGREPATCQTGVMILARTCQLSISMCWRLWQSEFAFLSSRHGNCWSFDGFLTSCYQVFLGKNNSTFLTMARKCTRQLITLNFLFGPYACHMYTYK